MIQASRVMGETYAGNVTGVKRVLRSVSAPLLVLAGLSLSACASDSGGAAPVGGQQTSAPGRPSDLPEITVVDVGSGGSVTLSALFPDPKPLVVWFWAPH